MRFASMELSVLQREQVHWKSRAGRNNLPATRFPAERCHTLYRGVSMSISGLTSAFNPTQISATANSYQQQLQQLSQALQSGNLTGAQSDFATLQQAFSQASTTTATSPGATSPSSSNPTTQAFNQLASDLQSGNITAAQKDLSAVQQAFKSVGPAAPVGRFHVHGGPVKVTGTTTGGSGSTTGGTSLQPFNPVATSSPAAAQQAYATMQQELQQFALGGEDSEEMSNMPISLVA
jgi:hypothetical protein